MAFALAISGSAAERGGGLALRASFDDATGRRPQRYVQCKKRHLSGAGSRCSGRHRPPKSTQPAGSVSTCGAYCELLGRPEDYSPVPRKHRIFTLHTDARANNSLSQRWLKADQSSYPERIHKTFAQKVEKIIRETSFGCSRTDTMLLSLPRLSALGAAMKHLPRRALLMSLALPAILSSGESSIATAKTGHIRRATEDEPDETLIFSVETVITFKSSIAIDLSRALDRLVWDDSQLKEGFVRDQLSYIIDKPFDIIAPLIGAAFARASISVLYRNPHDVKLEFKFPPSKGRLSALPPGSTSLPRLLHAKSAPDYRWTVNAMGSISYSDLFSRRIETSVHAGVYVEHKSKSGWTEVPQDWTSTENMDRAWREIIGTLLDRWPQLLESRYSLPRGAFSIGPKAISGRPG